MYFAIPIADYRETKNYRIVDGERATMSSINIIAIVILWEWAAGRMVSVLKVTVLVFFVRCDCK